ncbi:MAG: M48 family metallopeptidase [Candidatus Omnitrophica bacterium]|nr:M48 family metallopeptidase [Candidatus Omnitrophota bacterium]
MKFTPRTFKENVNISPGSPLRDLFVLLGGILGALLLIYIILGFALDILVERMPAKFEKRIADFFSRTYGLETPSSPAGIKTQELLDDLVQYLPEEDSGFTVYLHESSDVNAVALPGRHIIVFSGLLEEIESENELSMILAHELGHFANRDHLRGLGRGLVLMFISAVLFGADSSFANFSQRALLAADLKFSRQQETAADLFAIELLYKKYGHVGGACDFFQRASAKSDLPRFGKFLSTHPYPLDRINILQRRIKRNGYPIKAKIPLGLVFKEDLLEEYNKAEHD